MGKIANFLLVLFSELNDVLISKPANIVGLNDCLENREAMFHV
jgi:hypothetical protein